MRGATASAPSRKSSLAPPPTPTTPPWRPPCRGGHGRRSSGTQFRASAPPTPPKPPPVAPDHQSGHQRPADLQTTTPPGQREGSLQGGEERRKVTGTHPQKQGSRRNTSQKHRTPAGPPAPGDGKGREHSTAGTGARAHTHKGGTRHTGGTNTGPPSKTQPTPRDSQVILPHRTTRRTTREAHAHQDAPPQPGPDSAETTPGHGHQPPAPTRQEGGTPTRGTTESTAQPPQPNHQATTPATLHCRGHHTDTSTRTPGEERGQGHNTKDGGRN